MNKDEETREEVERLLKHQEELYSLLQFIRKQYNLESDSEAYNYLMKVLRVW